MKGTLELLKKDIFDLNSLLKKKRENFDQKFSYSVNISNENLNEIDLFTLGLSCRDNEENKDLEKALSFGQCGNEKSYKILYNKMKEYIFEEDSARNEIQKINKNNKKIIGIVRLFNINNSITYTKY